MNFSFCHDEFWDVNVTWNVEVPDLTSCFQYSMLILMPCIIFSLFSLISMCHIIKNMNPAPLLWTGLNVTKVVTCIILIVLSIFSVGIDFQKKVLNDQMIDSELLSLCAKTINFIIVLILMLVHKAYGVRTSTLLSLFWLCLSLCGIVIWRSSILRFLQIVTPASPKENFVLDMIYFPLIYLQLFLSCFADIKSYTSLEKVSPFDDEPFFSYISFTWFNGVVRKGLKRQLTVQDFVPLCLRQKSSFLWKRFKSKWSSNLISGNQLSSPTTTTQKSPSLAWTIIKAFWPWIVGTFILNITYDFITLIPPLILNLVIDFISSSESSWKGYFYCLLIILSDIIIKMVLNHFLFFAVAIGGQVKGALTEAIYRKCLRISNSTRAEYPSGSLTNLVSVDVQRITMFSMFFGNLIAAPLKIVLTMTLLWQYLGLSSIAGVIVIALLMPLTLWSSRAIAQLFEKQMKMKDLRLKDLNEILAGIKILKLYAWEVPFMKKISDIRSKELKFTLICQFCYVAIELIFSCAPILVAIASFATYLLIDKSHVLTPSTAFVSLNLMTILKYSLFEVPDTISELMQTNVSLGRIRKFLIAEEYDPDVVGNNPETGEDLTISNATFSWIHESEPTLKNISLNVKEQSLVAVIGPVGSGKSSLLSAALSEMYKISGTINIKGSLAYVPQQAWILNRTVKQNILLEKPLEERLYNEIVECCCMKPDLEILPGGDATEIGEKGINLSGGQKQRISLARAVFQNADVYLLDDPLSAVDSHVRKDLFENVIGHTGLLQNKTRIIVTHDISVLSRCDIIVSMKDGKIDEMGTYSDLVMNGGSFSEFLREHSNQDVAKDEEDSSKQISANRNSIEYQMDSVGDVGTSSLQIQHEEKENNIGVKLTEEERMEIGKVSRGVYINYTKHAGILMFILGFIGILTFEAFEIGSNIWLSEWSNDASMPNVTDPSSLRNLRLSVYGALGFAQVFASAVGSSFLVVGSLKAAKIYHSNMLQSVVKSPMSFFDTTPFGRIVNRFSADMDIVDVNIVYDIDGWLKCIVSIIGIFIVVGINLPIFFASLVPVMVFYYIIQKLYLNTSRQLKRLESVSKSPIFSHLLESIHGISSIKAYKVENQFTEKLESYLDIHLLCYFQSFSCNRWLAFWLNLLGDVVITVACFLAVQNRGVLSASAVGLTITYALSVTQSLLWLVRCNTQLENKSVSVERLEEYCKLTSEAPWNIPDCDPSFEWPKSGKIKFEKYSTRYREGLDLVLNQIDLEVQSNEKVGIVGRTGAGKSTITLALFRLLESATGRIVIDNIDVSNIGLHALRSKLTIIPQDPVLFTGSIRHNLDPNNEYSDDQIWRSLEQSHLKDFVSNLSDGLNHEVTEGGGNLSVGQRQLTCMARALLKRTKILVLDEATAAVDMDTDKLIQNTIRTEFRHHTVITIAHRLNTILDYDKIVVMDAGGVCEVGNPAVLLQDPETKFHSMAKDAQLL